MIAFDKIPHYGNMVESGFDFCSDASMSRYATADEIDQIVHGNLKVDGNLVNFSGAILSFPECCPPTIEERIDMEEWLIAKERAKLKRLESKLRDVEQMIRWRA